MSSIELEITESDIRNYLNIHKEDNDIKYREAMFVKYIKEKGMLTKEILEIMMRKYNNNSDLSYEHFHELPNFHDYLSDIKNLDISGICHILIPALKTYSPKCWVAFKPETILEDVAKNFDILVDDSYSVVSSVVDDYNTAFVQRSVTRIINDEFIDISLSKAWCDNELNSYANIYGYENVEKIKQLVRDRM